ncbi:transglutaminase family protein [Terricaulis sp.]|uniref:transglutaminase-like domain-containing protein n=1 Tax=Terricaulis sp. TaxID=2768686 RepID=UPI002AC6776F|nr:transglutaminase family protein [Terricaulis sp.]MDZ4691601.1 transglutaminase family protein [Terricaulis sp.]
MLIRGGFDITYDCPAPASAVLTLNVHPTRRADLQTPDTLTNDRGVAMPQYIDGFGNICTRVILPAGSTTFSSDFLITDSGQPDDVAEHAKLTPIQDLPDDVMVYLLGSRYCETDRMSELAWSLFGKTPPGWARVQSIVDYTHERITFGYPHARATRTAWEAHEERLGVCRDYAHLAVTLCRCMSVPARYCTGYLGDIGVPYSDAPMDFSAWFEAFLDGAWHTFDARHNTPRIGRILIARGRDATDTAIATTYGAATLTGFKVVTDEVAANAAVASA